MQADGLILSVAHAPQSRGASYKDPENGVYTEYDLSKPLTQIVVQNLINKGYKVDWFDGGDAYPENEDYTKVVLPEKIRVVNELAEEYDEPLCAEIHFNTIISKGTCVLYNTGSEKGKEVAESLLPYLLRMNFGQHWKGVIPIPGPYRNKRVSFLSETIPPAVIIETCSIKDGPCVEDNLEALGEIIASAFEVVLSK